MFIVTYPIFIIVVSFLFILGAKSKFHLYSSIFLSVVLAAFILFIIVSIFQKLNRTINEVIFDENSVEFKTFKIFFLNSKKFKIDNRQIKWVPKKFQIDKNEIEEGWKIKPINKNYEIYLMKNFFDTDIEKYLKLCLNPQMLDPI